MAFNQTKFFDELEQLTERTIEKDLYDDFIFSFLHLLDKPKSTITQLQKGSERLNVAEYPEQGEIALKMGLYYKPAKGAASDDLKGMLDTIKQSDKLKTHKIRMVMVTNFDVVLLHDLKVDETIDVPFLELYKDYSFLLPLAGLERAVEYTEHPADVKAAEKMGRLFDQIKKNNDFESQEDLHALNSFLVRILFCLFAEDTGIFKKNQFHDALVSTTKEDGSDTAGFLTSLFEVLDSPPNSEQRDNSPSHLSAFPYVNGSLFEEQLPVPSFDRRTRRLLLNCSEMNWADINPDIFGSMFQAVVDTEQRGTLGQHYTSVPNIMKVISPLFLDELKEEFEKIRSISESNRKKYRKEERFDELLDRMSKIKVVDPSCGSFNFGLIAYKELRLLEMQILKVKQEMYGALNEQQNSLGLGFNSCISLDNFYGIEYDHFASKIAKLSLWLAEHQMNLKFKELFGVTPATLPLRDSGHIVHGNALRIDWNEVCPNNGTDEIYIVGNPPFGGTGNRSKEQSEDMELVFKGFKSFKALDYVACWFWKGAQYIAGTRAKLALVSTNSISQGMQPSLIFKPIFDLGVEIEFAYQSLPWSNNAKNKAAVHVVVIGLSDKSNINKKTIFSLLSKEWHSEVVESISAYLIKGGATVVERLSKPLHKGSAMIRGSMATDGGRLFLTSAEKENILLKYPKAKQWVKRALGSDEFLNGKERWCLWFDGEELSELEQYPLIKDRLDIIRSTRSASKPKSTRVDAKTPHLFQQISQPKSGNYILVPRVSSERRAYVPIGFFDASVICTDANQMIPNGTLFDFALVTSLAHNDWMRLVAGRLKSDYRYSSTVVYNTFPFPEANEEQKKHIETLAENVILAREHHPDKTLAEMYDPDKMPSNLLQAHRELDKAVDELYKAGGFRNASERVEHLLKLYEKEVANEKNK